MAEREGRLHRWARRKAVVDAPERPADELSAALAPEVSSGELTEAEPVAETPPEATADDLPDIDSLDKDSDYTVFLQDKVPQAIRNMALRRLWRSDPVFANLDGLVDYGEDFTDAATVIAGMKSAYQVGKGYITEEDEKAAAEAEAAAEEEAAKGAEADEAKAADATDVDEGEGPEGPSEAAGEPAAEDGDGAAPEPDGEPVRVPAPGEVVQAQADKAE